MKRVFSLFLLSLTGCATSTPHTAFLSFTETTPEDEYPVRMLVTEKFLRIEDGDGSDGYVLFDRAAGTIYSVSHTARTVLVVRAEPVTLKPPATFTHQIERLPGDVPKVGGKPVVPYRFTTNGERCFEVYAAEDLLPFAVTALREYRLALAGEQAAMQARMPAAMQSVCDLADQIFVPGRHLARGFPVRQVNHEGVIRQLTDYKVDVPVEAKLFELPKDYKQFSPAEMRKR